MAAVAATTLATAGGVARADRWFVSPSTATTNPGSDSNGGHAWNDAFATVTKALALADADTSGVPEIWVRMGTYAPDDANTSNNPSATFTVQTSGIRLLGGFAGTETAANQRSPATHTTTLTGLLSGTAKADQALTCTSVDRTTLVSGFKITSAGKHGVYVDGTVADTEPVLDTLDVSTNGDVDTNGDPTSTTNSGAGMYVVGSQAFPTLRSCTFTNNVAASGGALYIETDGPHVFATDCTFSKNQAVAPMTGPIVSGGAVFNGSAAISTFRRCTFSENIARPASGGSFGGEAGALAQYGGAGELRIFQCTFTSNVASGVFPFGGNGGAIVDGAGPGSTLILYNSTFALNRSLDPPSADGGGGALWSSKDSGIKSMNCLYYDNYTDGVGGAITDSGSFPEVYHITVTKNTSVVGYSGVYSNTDGQTGPLPKYQNCIFYGNHVTSGLPSDNFYDANQSVTADVTWCDIGEGGRFGTGNISADPLFVAIPLDNYRLQANSPCVDGGNPDPSFQDHFDLNGDTFTDCAGACSGHPGERVPDLDLRRRVRHGPNQTGNNNGLTEDACRIGCSCIPDLGCYEFAALPDSCDDLGDVNRDHVVDGADVYPFELCLHDVNTSGPGCPCADMNGDGQVTAADVPCIVEKLLTGTSSCEAALRCATHDCNTNGTEDVLDILHGTSSDYNTNGIPDECESPEPGGGEGGGEGGNAGQGAGEGQGGGGNAARQAQLAALQTWDTDNPPSGYATYADYLHARAEFMAGICMVQGIGYLGIEAYCSWLESNPYRNYRSSMTLTAYEAMCSDQLAASLAAAASGCP